MCSEQISASFINILKSNQVVESQKGYIFRFQTPPCATTVVSFGNELKPYLLTQMKPWRDEVDEMKSRPKDSSHDFGFCLYEKQSEAIDVESKRQAYGATCLQPTDSNT